MLRRSKLEEVITDETAQQFAGFINGMLRILLRLVPGSHARCLGYDNKLREQLAPMDIAPFANKAQWYSQTYLEGYQLDGKTIGISLWLRSNGFQSIIWEGPRHDGAHHEAPMADVMNNHPDLRADFPEHKAGEYHWIHPEIIPFDSVIDWLKELQELLKRLQAKGN